MVAAIYSAGVQIVAVGVFIWVVLWALSVTRFRGFFSVRCGVGILECCFGS